MATRQRCSSTTHNVERRGCLHRTVILGALGLSDGSGGKCARGIQTHNSCNKQQQQSTRIRGRWMRRSVGRPLSDWRAGGRSIWMSWAIYRADVNTCVRTMRRRRRRGMQFSLCRAAWSRELLTPIDNISQLCSPSSRVACDMHLPFTVLSPARGSMRSTDQT